MPRPARVTLVKYSRLFYLILYLFLCSLQLIFMMNSDISKVAYCSTVFAVPSAKAFSVSMLFCDVSDHVTQNA